MISIPILRKRINRLSTQEDIAEVLDLLTEFEKSTNLIPVVGSLQNNRGGEDNIYLETEANKKLKNPGNCERLLAIYPILYFRKIYEDMEKGLTMEEAEIEANSLIRK